MAHKRPRAPNVAPSSRASYERAERPDSNRLTRAEEHALRPGAPLTPQQFKELSRLAEQGISPLGRL